MVNSDTAVFSNDIDSKELKFRKGDEKIAKIGKFGKKRDTHYSR